MTKKKMDKANSNSLHNNFFIIVSAGSCIFNTYFLRADQLL